MRPHNKHWQWLVAVSAIILVALGLLATRDMVANAQASPPTDTLGTYTAAEDGSANFIPIPGAARTNTANTYLSWGQGIPTTFMKSAWSQGATALIEIESWHTGPHWNGAPPSLINIAANGDSSDTNCSLNLSSYNTSCATWLAALGKAIAAFGHPVELEFDHEFNVSGQYPWAHGDTGSCGSSSCTPAQWIAAWDKVQSIVNSNANGLAYWMWAPNADTGGSTTDPSQWWPGASRVNMLGVDGYPNTRWGSQFGTFAGEFGKTFSELHKLSSLPIFIAETNLSPLGSNGYESIPNFINDLCRSGGTGVLEFEESYSAKMSSAQWALLNTALAHDCATNTGGGVSTSTATATATATSPAPYPVPCQSVAPSSAASNFRVNVRGSYVQITWNAVSHAQMYVISVNTPDKRQWRENVVFSNSATYLVVPMTGTYTYKVQALNNMGPGPWSAIQSFTVTS